jgi:hypothetical protein
LAANSCARETTPRDIPVWSGNVSHIAGGHRIEVDSNHDDRNGLARRYCRFQGKFRTKSHHQVDVRANQFGRAGEDLGRSFVHPSVLDDHILALGESELAQFSKKDRIIRSKKHVVRRGN